MGKAGIWLLWGRLSVHWGGVQCLAWASPSKGAELQRRCLSCLPSDEWRAALLPFPESSRVWSCETQDCRTFLVWGVWAFQKTICRCFLICSQCFTRQAAFFMVCCVVQIMPRASGSPFPAAERPLGIDKAPDLQSWIRGHEARPQDGLWLEALLRLAHRSCGTSENSGVEFWQCGH